MKKRSPEEQLAVFANRLHRIEGWWVYFYGRGGRVVHNDWLSHRQRGEVRDVTVTDFVRWADVNLTRPIAAAHKAHNRYIAAGKPSPDKMSAELRARERTTRAGIMADATESIK